MGEVWSVGIFAEDNNYEIGLPLKNLIKIFNAKKVRSSKKHVHTYADPFLFVYEEMLFLFTEIQETGGTGYINAWKTNDLKNWQNLGSVLKKQVHYSYPFLFHDAKSDKIYLLPEAGQKGGIYLYEFENFPEKIKTEIKIVEGNYADSNIIILDNVYYLITTNIDTNELELFWSDDLVVSIWQRHPASPLTADRRISRNGGGFIQVNKKLYRVAQNTKTKYGEGIVILEVLRLNTYEYLEKVIVEDFKPAIDFKWQLNGRHHLSLVEFKEQKIVAIDGLQDDFFLNKALNLIYKFI